MEHEDNSPELRIISHRPQSVIILISVMAILFVLGNCLIYFGIEQIKSWSVKTPATVSAINTSHRNSNTYYSLQVQFQANDKIITTNSSIETNLRPPMNVGDTVTVYYNPDNPYSVFILKFDSFLLLWIGIIFCLISVIPILIGSFLYSSGVNTWSKYRDLLQDKVRMLKIMLVYAFFILCSIIPMLYILLFDDGSFNMLMFDLLH